MTNLGGQIFLKKIYLNEIMKKILFLIIVSLQFHAVYSQTSGDIDSGNVQDSFVTGVSSDDSNFLDIPIENNKSNLQGFTCGLYWDQPLHFFYIDDSEGSALYSSSVMYNLGLICSYKDFAADITLVGFYLKEYDDAQSSLGDINFYYTDNHYLIHAFYYNTTGSFTESDDEIAYYPDLQTNKFEANLYYQILGDVSLRNIFIRNEYQRETKTGLLGRIAVEHYSANNDGNIIPDYASDDFTNLTVFESLSAFAVAPMIGGIVNFHFFQDESTLAFGLTAGPNVIYNYDIKGGEFDTNLSIQPKVDFIVVSSYIMEKFYISCLGISDFFITSIDQNSSLVSYDTKIKIYMGYRF